MGRKTMNVNDFVEKMNETLRISPDTPDSRLYRQGIIQAIEEVLHTTDNYKGFAYLTVIDLPQGQTPGIRDLNIVTNEWDFTNTDNSRVKYFTN